MKQIILSTVFLFCILSGFAQDHPPMDHEKQSHARFEKIKALKTAHITNELKLTSKEAQQFWPIYNASEEKINKLQKESRELRKKVMHNFESLSEAEAAKIVKRSMALESNIHQEKTKVIKQLMTVVSAKKIIKLKKAEHEFNRKLLQKFRGKDNSRMKAKGMRNSR